LPIVIEEILLNEPGTRTKNGFPASGFYAFLRKEKLMKNRTMLKVTLLSLSLIMMCANAVSVALADIAKAFPQESPGTIALILTLPSLFIIPFTLISGFLSNILRKRTVTIAGLLVIALGGIAPIFIHNFFFILVMRAVLGAGLGIIMPMASGLIPCFFEGDEQYRLFGFQAAMINLGQIVLSLVAGYLTLLGWNNVFWSTAIVIPVLLLIITNLPEPEKRTENAKVKEKISLNKIMLLICTLGILLGILIYSFFANASNYVISHGFGDASTVGLLLTTITIAGLFFGLIFAKVFAALKHFTSAFGCLCFGIGYLLLSQAAALPVVFVASVLIGGQCFIMTYLLIMTAKVSDKTSVTMATGLFYSSAFLGQFLSPIVMINLTNALGNPSERFTFLLCALVLLTGAVVITVINLIKRKGTTEQKMTESYGQSNQKG
jgi:MFS family permease